MGGTESATGFITENVIASNVDTVTAAIATTEVRARFMTDDGDWETQRTARHLEWYAEGVSKLHDVDAKCALAFGQGAAVRGTGLIYVGIEDGKLCVEHVLADDIVVDERECRSGSMPKQMHRRRLVDKDDLIARYPEFAEQIERAVTSRGAMSTWAGYRPVESNQVVVVYSWIRPLGNRKGRYTVCIDGQDLDDKEWTDDGFPFAKIVWAERVGGWYGIGLAERIKGHQRVLNRSNWHIDRLVERDAIPTTYVRRADAKLAVQSINRLGTIAVVNGEPPVTVAGPAVHPELYRRQETVKASASQESGVSQMAQHGTKPAGLDSGVALREYRDQTTQRFATQEKAYERLKLDVTCSCWAAARSSARTRRS
jgi:Uri superfamily endonuclease